MAAGDTPHMKIVMKFFIAWKTTNEMRLLARNFAEQRFDVNFLRQCDV